MGSRSNVLYTNASGAAPMSINYSEQYAIQFPYQKIAQLMPSPLVIASLSPDTTDIIDVSIIVYLPDTVVPGSFSMKHLFGLNPSGFEQVQFFIIADYDNTLPSNSFIGYQFDFQFTKDNLPEDVELDNIVTIQAFLWNEDPKTSRGTVTTVAKA